MHKISKKIIAIALTIFVFAFMVYGTFLPFLKSQRYIQARNTSIGTLQDFNQVYGDVLQFPSPVGQNELVSNYLEVVSNAIDQEQAKGQIHEDIIRPLVASSTMWAEPLIQKGVGFSYSQMIFNYGNVYREAALVLKDKDYYYKAIDLYKLGLTKSPNRQIFLYTLFDMYRMVGDKENASSIGDIIMQIYNDPNVAKAMKTL